jgi:hypothetical protein
MLYTVSVTERTATHVTVTSDWYHGTSLDAAERAFQRAKRGPMTVRATVTADNGQATHQTNLWEVSEAGTVFGRYSPLPRSF